MPTTKSAVKRMRSADKRRERNAAYKSRIRTQRRKLLQAIEAGDRTEATKNYSALASLYDKAIQKGVMKLNTASRYKARITNKINALPT